MAAPPFGGAGKSLKTLAELNARHRGAGPRQSRSVRAGLVFSVARIHRKLKEGRYAPRLSSGSSIYLAGVLEYLAAELLEVAGVQAKRAQKMRITARHIQLAVRADAELDVLLAGVVIPDGGALPGIHSALLRKKGERSPTI